ncbi:MAG: hypothetical protein KF713_11275 [Turneriella sp.]|nr:hypothetical protein [Turneriella sp.]
MPSVRENPFDYPYEKRPYIGIMVHSESLRNHLLNGSILCEQLFGLLEYDAVRIYLTPIKNKELLSKATESQWPVAKWAEFQGVVNISQGRVDVRQPKENERLENTPFVSGSAYSLFDHLSNLHEYYHFMVLEDTDPVFSSPKKPEEIITIKQALDYARLILVCHNYFWISRSWRATEFEYYAYRHRNYFEPISWLAAYITVESGKVDLRAFSNSLRLRLELWCRAVDKARIFSMRSNLADRFQKTLYDFNYHLLLTTGIFENIAWIINYTFELGFDRSESQKMGLRNSSKNVRKFLAKIPDSNLKSLLKDQHTQEIIEIFYDLRDEMAHNIVGDGHTTTRHGIFDSGTKLEIPTKTADRLKKLASEEQWGFNSDSLFPREQTTITVHKFCEQSSKFLRKFVNSVLTEIQAKLEETLVEDVKKGVRKKATDFRTTGTKMGNFHVQPYYFCPEIFFDNCD